METHYLNGKNGGILYLKTTRLWAFSEDRKPVTRIGNRGVVPNYKAETLHQSTCELSLGGSNRSEMPFRVSGKHDSQSSPTKSRSHDLTVPR
jgi:hypothetical protein